MDKHPNLVQLGNTLRKFREMQGLSQEELAHRVDLHRTYVGSIERGERNLGFLNLDKILSELGISWIEFANHLDKSSDPT